MQFDSTLNLVWLLLGFPALAGATRVFFCRTRAVSRKYQWLHIVGVGLIVAALFPYISATDDVLRIEHLKARHDSCDPKKQTHNDGLMRLYETLDSPLVSPVNELALIFFFVPIVFTSVTLVSNEVASIRAGRSPPSPVTQ